MEINVNASSGVSQLAPNEVGVVVLSKLLPAVAKHELVENLVLAAHRNRAGQGFLNTTVIQGIGTVKVVDVERKDGYDGASDTIVVLEVLFTTQNGGQRAGYVRRTVMVDSYGDTRLVDTVETVKPEPVAKVHYVRV